MTTNVLWLLVASVSGVAEAAPRTYQSLVADIISIVDIAIPIVISAAILYYTINITKTLLDEKGGVNQQKLRTSATWGILIIFVMVSIWGILRLLHNTLTSRPAELGADSALCGGLDECSIE